MKRTNEISNKFQAESLLFSVPSKVGKKEKREILPFIFLVAANWKDSNDRFKGSNDRFKGSNNQLIFLERVESKAGIFFLSSKRKDFATC